MTLYARRLGPGELDHERLWGWVLLVSGVWGALALATEALPQAVLLCPLKIATGLPCPTCGTTRSVFALARGDWSLAFRLHPLVPPSVLLGLSYVAYAIVSTSADLPRVRVALSTREIRALRWGVGAVVLAVWTFLVIDGR